MVLEAHPLPAAPSAKRAVSTRRRRKSGGNTVIESVFTLLPLFAIIFAFIDFGLMLFRWTTLQSAVREGCRYAITFQRQTVSGSTLGQNDSIKSVVETYAMGLVHATDTNPVHIFVNYYDSTTLASASNIPGNIVEVSIQNVSFSWLAPLSGSYGFGIPFYRSSTPLSLAVYSSDLLGGYPVGITSVPQ
jgi:hypothetical protein